MFLRLLAGRKQWNGLKVHALFSPVPKVTLENIVPRGSVWKGGGEVEVGVSVVTGFPFPTQSSLTSANYLFGFQPVSTSWVLPLSTGKSWLHSSWCVKIHPYANDCLPGDKTHSHPIPTVSLPELLYSAAPVSRSGRSKAGLDQPC